MHPEISVIDSWRAETNPFELIPQCALTIVGQLTIDPKGNFKRFRAILERDA